MSGRKSRQNYRVVPESVTGPASLILLLHGSGREGTLQIDAWQELAERQGKPLPAFTGISDSSIM